MILNFYMYLVRVRQPISTNQLTVTAEDTIVEDIVYKKHIKRQLEFYGCAVLSCFTTVCFIFLLKVKWYKNNSAEKQVRTIIVKLIIELVQICRGILRK